MPPDPPTLLYLTAYYLAPPNQKILDRTLNVHSHSSLRPQAMIDDGLNMIETYVFWNVHEPVQGEPYTFDGYANLTLFIEKAARAGLFVNLRIGPYVCAEWNWGKPFSIHTVSYLPMGMGTKLMGVIVAG